MRKGDIVKFWNVVGSSDENFRMVLLEIETNSCTESAMNSSMVKFPL
ncbi:hypothetical protein [Geobacter argillaceus]|uniref:Uncharacterized protein n=1 Tax=Geobacter argillaceus TaxID=345631 RepID=A0A562UZP6_9BACT|nr:hypothetical protein [Geobacter argillaceus]TWJ11124.1 hypothetical protein JN12_04066 [Geobacter argillaceus]